MSTPTTTHVKFFISAALFVFMFPAHADWKVDFSHHTVATPSTGDLRAPASLDAPIVATDSAMAPPSPQVQAPPPSPNFLQSLFRNNEPSQDIVILNTDKGFLPSTIRVQKGMTYKIDVVNIDDQNKNVSFVMDSFSEHHATYYGKIKSFVIRPARVGVYRFESPETSAQGKLVVFPSAQPSVETRMPASE